jgi:acetyl esterase/lipase
MSPEHHEERLRAWALRTGRPVLAIDYGKAPECESCDACLSPQPSYCPTIDPYPFAIDEAFDVYRVLVESAGTVIGMSGRKLNIIISGDSA